MSMAAISQAQLLSFTTLTGGYNNTTGHATGGVLGSDVGATQTFLGITSIDTVTFRFIASTPGSGTTMDVYFSEWSGSDATSSLGVGSFSLPTLASWTSDAGLFYYDMAFDLTTVAGSLNALTTYALTVVGNADTVAGNYRLGRADIPYPGGDGFTHSGVTTFGDLTSGGSSFGSDYAFTANSASGYDAFTPVPEASTVAVLFAALFAGGMAAFRMRQRRQKLATAIEG